MSPDGLGIGGWSSAGGDRSLEIDLGQGGSNRDNPLEERLQLVQRKHGSAIRRGACRIRMNLQEEAVTSSRNGGTHQGLYKFPIASPGFRNAT